MVPRPISVELRFNAERQDSVPADADLIVISCAETNHIWQLCTGLRVTGTISFSMVYYRSSPPNLGRVPTRQGERSESKSSTAVFRRHLHLSTHLTVTLYITSSIHSPSINLGHLEKMAQWFNEHTLRSDSVIGLPFDSISRIWGSLVRIMIKPIKFGFQQWMQKLSQARCSFCFFAGHHAFTSKSIRWTYMDCCCCCPSAFALALWCSCLERRF